MRIDGADTFPATADRVYAALLDPEALMRILPECERLVQLGPGDAGAGYEARLRSENQVITARVRLIAARRPAHLRFELRLHLPAGQLRGRGLVDLVDHGEHTIGAYVLELSGSADHPEAVSGAGENMQEAGQRIVRALCKGLARELHLERLNAEQQLVTGPSQIPRAVAVTTPRGRIVALAPSTPGLALSTRAAIWRQRALWMGGGILLGVSTLALVVGLVRRLAERE